jgi:hypothetical protein
MSILIIALSLLFANSEARAEDPFRITSRIFWRNTSQLGFGGTHPDYPGIISVTEQENDAHYCKSVRFVGGKEKDECWPRAGAPAVITPANDIAMGVRWPAICRSGSCATTGWRIDDAVTVQLERRIHEGTTVHSLFLQYDADKGSLGLCRNGVAQASVEFILDNGQSNVRRIARPLQISCPRNYGDSPGAVSGGTLFLSYEKDRELWDTIFPLLGDGERWLALQVGIVREDGAREGRSYRLVF